MSQPCSAAPEIEQTTTIKELLLTHPSALRVLVDRQVPVTCSECPIAEAARAAGLSPSTLLVEIRVAVEREAEADGRRQVRRRRSRRSRSAPAA